MTPLEAHQRYAAAAQAAAEARKALRGRHVRWGFLGRFEPDAPTGRIADITTNGIKVKWDDPQRCHGMDYPMNPTDLELIK